MSIQKLTPQLINQISTITAEIIHKKIFDGLNPKELYEFREKLVDDANINPNFSKMFWIDPHTIKICIYNIYKHKPVVLEKYEMGLWEIKTAESINEETLNLDPEKIKPFLQLYNDIAIRVVKKWDMSEIINDNINDINQVLEIISTYTEGNFGRKIFKLSIPCYGIKNSTYIDVYESKEFYDNFKPNPLEFRVNVM